jgi:hypothetical protein
LYSQTSKAFLPILFVCLGSMFTRVLLAQADPNLSEAVTRDLQASTLILKANQALTAGTPINDAVLSGNATWIAGSTNESGPATMAFAGQSHSRFELQLQTASRTEIRNYDSRGKALAISAGGKEHETPLHGSFIPAAWFTAGFKKDGSERRETEKIVEDTWGLIGRDRNGKRLGHPSFCSSPEKRTL